MGTSEKMQLIRKLRNPDHKTVLQIVEELRERGWLFDGSLRRMDLRCAHLGGADLSQANLEGADMRMADLRDADLGRADLSCARLSRANLLGTNLGGANLQDADLFNTDLEMVTNLTTEQLAQARRLRAATLPGGGRYDGRFNLRGDRQDSQVIHVDLSSADEMAEFYRVSVEAYRGGQIWAEEHLSEITRGAEVEAPSLELQLITQLCSEDNRAALRAVEELRSAGWLDAGVLKGVNLRGANLKGACLNLTGMEGVDLSEANLELADLSVVNFYKASLCRANLRRARLLWASLQSADLTEASLQEANLTGANLRYTRLENADLQGAILGAANLKGSDLAGVNLRGASNLREEELARAYRLEGAMLPDGSRYDGRFNLPGDKEQAAIPLQENL